jgi:hypothetical protein
MCDTPFS